MKIDNKLKKYLIKTGSFLLVDIVVAALVVLGYYWFTFKAPKKEREPQTLLTFESTTTSSKETETEFNSSDVSSEEATTGDTIGEFPSGDTLEDMTTDNTTEEVTTEETKEETQPSSTEPPAPTLREKFADHFTSEAVYTENSYSDQNISISITSSSVGEGEDRIAYQIADIYVADIRYFGAGIYNDDGTFQHECSPEKFSMDNPNAVLFINGDYCGFNSQGLIIRNGKLYRDEPTTVEQLVMFADGSMKIYQPGEFTFDLAASSGVWQSWCFGPSLLNDDGSAKTEFPHQDYLLKNHPRTAIGYYEPGHYCFVTVDGREENYSRGMNLYELSNLFANIGCKVAYNLDGGSSSCMLFGGRGINHFSGRYMSDFVVVSLVPLA